MVSHRRHAETGDLSSKFLYRPDIRDALILDPDAYSTLELSGAVLSGFLSANWLHSPAQLLDVEADTGDLMLSALFKDHALNLDNWSIDSEADLQCPVTFSKAWLHQICGLHAVEGK